MDDNIGSVYNIKGVTYKIVGRREKIKGKPVKYILECNKCSKDKSLWPYGSIETIKCNLTKGQLCCGCSRSPKWSEEQNRIRVHRLCNDKGYKFLGWFGDYNKDKTYLMLENPETNNRWNTTNLNNLLHGYGDPLQGRVNTIKASLKSEEYHIKDFTGYAKGTVFKRVSGGEWEYKCGICSQDKYVKNGVCSGIFKSTISGLKAGKKSCRCGSSYRYTPEQRLLDCEWVVSQSEITGYGFEDYSKFNAKVKYKWRCKCGNQNSTEVYRFVNGQLSCGSCSQFGNVFGLYDAKVFEPDTLYIIELKSDDECFIKIGRSFNTQERFKEYRRYYDITPIFTCSRIHLSIFEVERKLHRSLKPLKIKPLIQFGGSRREAYSTEVLNFVDKDFFDVL